MQDNKTTPARWPRISRATPDKDDRGYTMHTAIVPPAKPGRTFKVIVRQPPAKRQ